MVYEAFLTEMKTRMEQALGGDYRLSLHKVPKNNGTVLDGLCIAGKDSNVAPAIYLNSCYRQYLNGRPLDEITAELLTLYRDNETPDIPDCRRLADFNAMKDRIAFRLINKASNEGLLQEIPYMDWQDLALVFYLCVQEDQQGLMTAMIHRQHLRLWNISLSELYRLALHNTPRLFPPVISSIARLIEELTDTAALCPAGEPADAATLLQAKTSDDGTAAPFYVLTNSCGINGSACILYPGVLKHFAEGMGKDILILPSSIHEVLLLPDEGNVSCEALSRLISRVNRSQVPSWDRLSNQVYLYSRDDGRTCLASHCTQPIC